VAGDGPLSVRARPSSPKRDCARRTTSTGGKPWPTYTRSHAWPWSLYGPSGQKPRARQEPARTGRGPSPARCGSACCRRACARVTATAATNSKHQQSATAHNTRTIRHNPGICPARKTDGRGSARQAPRLLPSRRTTPVPCGRPRNIGPAHGLKRTVLDNLPAPTDLRVAVWVAVHLGARPSSQDQPRRLVQLEPIRTAATRAANAAHTVQRESTATSPSSRQRPRPAAH
jgi:hypothetical protein